MGMESGGRRIVVEGEGKHLVETRWKDESCSRMNAALDMSGHHTWTAAIHPGAAMTDTAGTTATQARRGSARGGHRPATGRTRTNAQSPQLLW